jgi:hypothetical protein
MKPVQTDPMNPTLTFLIALLLSPLAALAERLELANDPATGGPGQFPEKDIRREAEAKGMTLGD